MKHIKNIFYMLSVQLANYAFPIITIPIVSRVFGPEKIGLINYIAAVIAYFSLLVSYSFNFTGVRRITRNRDKAKEIFSIIFATQGVILIFCCLIFTLFLFVLKDFRENFYLSVITFSSCISMLFTQNWFLQANNDFKLIAKISFLSKLLSFVLILLLIKNPSDILIYAAILNVTNLMTAMFVFFIVIKKYNINLKLPRLSSCMLYLKEDRNLFFSSVVTNVYTTTGIVILGALGTKIDVGYYTSAQKLIDVTRSIVLMPITQIIFPLLSEKFGKNQKDGILAVRKLMPTFILISVAVLISINLFRDVIVRVIFGEQFMAVIPLITILSFGLFAVFYGVIIGGQVMLNLGLDRAFLNIQIIISVISLIVNAIAIPKGGAIVTASVWSISEVIISLYQIIYLKRLGITVITWKMLSITEIIGSIKYVFKKDN